jgi:hypothetical protein
MRPAINYDTVLSTDYAWFVYTVGSQANPANIRYNRLQWNNGIPAFQDSWSMAGLAVNGSITLDKNGLWDRAPQKNDGTTGSKGKADVESGRLSSTIVRKINGTQYLWTCRAIGVDSSGTGTSTSGDRCGIEWIKMTTGGTPAIVDQGRIYDGSASPRFYYMPSMAVNRNGDAIIACSASSVNDYIGGFYTWKLAGTANFATPISYVTGKTWFQSGDVFFRWGDYSESCLDPDGLTLWTIQEYAENRLGSPPPITEGFGTWILAVTPF